MHYTLSNAIIRQRNLSQHLVLPEELLPSIRWIPSGIAAGGLTVLTCGFLSCSAATFRYKCKAIGESSD
jgi:hypothetical protein